MKLLIILLLFPLTAFAQLPSLGEQKTLVILVNFTDKQDESVTAAFADDMVFNQVNDYYLENSYNQTWITGNVMGWFTIPVSSTTCDNRIADEAKIAAANAGANLSDYQHFIYWFPVNACTFPAAGGYPVNGISEMWVKGVRDMRVIAHEFGHNLDLHHSRSYDCGSESICSGGVIDEYGDYFDLMGPSNRPYAAHFNVSQKERLGWLTTTLVAAHGDYTIDNLENGLGSKGLKIPKAQGFYYIEKRSVFGFDSFLSGSQYANVRNGVLVHQIYDGDLFSYLLDMSPPNDWFDPALTVGHSFVDTSIDLGVTLLSVNSTGAVVRVTCAACVPPPDNTPPTVQITSPTGTVPRNTTVTIQATASDNVGVDRVHFSVKGVLLCTDFSAPYSCSWAVPGKKNASYTLRADAYDAWGNVGTHSIVVVAP